MKITEKVIKGITWKITKDAILEQRCVRSEMYASLEEPTIKISELMVSCPERFVVERGVFLVGSRAVSPEYLVKEGILELVLRGCHLTGELFNQHELTFLLPFVKTLVDNHLQKEFNASLALEKESLLKEEEERLLKRKALSEQYKDDV